jgi:hypothetical protein
LLSSRWRQLQSRRGTRGRADRKERNLRGLLGYGYVGVVVERVVISGESHDEVTRLKLIVAMPDVP